MNKTEQLYYIKYSIITIFSIRHIETHYKYFNDLSIVKERAEQMKNSNTFLNVEYGEAHFVNGVLKPKK